MVGKIPPTIDVRRVLWWVWGSLSSLAMRNGRYILAKIANTITRKWKRWRLLQRFIQKRSISLYGRAINSDVPLKTIRKIQSAYQICWTKYGCPKPYSARITEEFARNSLNRKRRPMLIDPSETCQFLNNRDNHFWRSRGDNFHLGQESCGGTVNALGNRARN